MKRPSNSVIMACAVALIVVAWMATGMGSADKSDAAGNEAATAELTAAGTANAPRVAIARSRARAITREIVVSGRTEPNRVVTLRAETEGRVVARGGERGTAGAAGGTVVGGGGRGREARRAEAGARSEYGGRPRAGARPRKQEPVVWGTQQAEGN
jgi:multidrug efflux system membrane fusion protein